MPKKIFNLKIEPEAIAQLKAIAKSQGSYSSKLVRSAVHNLIREHSHKSKTPAA